MAASVGYFVKISYRYSTLISSAFYLVCSAGCIFLSVTVLVADVVGVTDAITNKSLHLPLPTVLFPSDFPTKILKSLLASRMRSVYLVIPVHITLPACLSVCLSLSRSLNYVMFRIPDHQKQKPDV
jgi:hypothetical protein